MTSKSKNITPDIALYTDTWVLLGRALRKQIDFENRLDFIQAQILMEVRSAPQYFIQGKVPSMSYCKAVYLHTGHTPETKECIADIKSNLSTLTERIIILRGILKSEEMKLSVFQTLSANARDRFSLE